MQTIAIVYLLSATIICNQLHASEDSVKLKNYCGQKKDPDTAQTKKKLEKLTNNPSSTSSITLKAMATTTDSKSTKTKNLKKQNKKRISCFPCKFCNYLSGDYF